MFEIFKHDKKKLREVNKRLWQRWKHRVWREHPIACKWCLNLACFGIGLVIVGSLMAAWNSGVGYDSLRYLGFALWFLPPLWLAVVLRLGPLSPARKARAEFWKRFGITLVIFAVYSLIKVILATAALVYAGRSSAAILGQSLPDYLWEHCWEARENRGLIWRLAAIILASLAMLIAARLLRPLVRRLEGNCVRCNYDLRRLPEPRCPECGRPFDPAKFGIKLRPLPESAEPDRSAN